MLRKLIAPWTDLPHGQSGGEWKMWLLKILTFFKQISFYYFDKITITKNNNNNKIGESGWGGALFKM